MECSSPPTHLCLVEIASESERAFPNALHCKVSLSGTRCSCCKMVVLITLGGCHLLDALVVVSDEARKKLVRCSREVLCEGHCARPAGAMKSNSS